MHESLRQTRPGDAGETRLEAVLAQLPALLYTTDRELRVTSVTGGGARGLGHDPDGLVGLTMGEVVDRLGGDRDRILPYYARALQGESTSHVSVLRSCVLQIHLQPLRDERGISGVVGVGLDITERHRAEASLRERERWLSLLLTQLPATVWTADADLRITSIAGRAPAGVGEGLNLLEGESVERLGDGEEMQAMLRETHSRALAGEPAEFEGVLLGRVLRVHLEPLRIGGDHADGNAGAIGVGMDVTEQRGAERELRLREDQLHRIAKLEALGQMARGVSHDFSNVLIAMGAHLELARMSEGRDGLGEATLSKLEACVEQARLITSTLQRFSGKPPEGRRREDLAVFLKSMREPMKHVLSSKIELDLRLPQDNAMQMEIEEGALQEMLLGFASNARDAMPDGGVFRIELGRSGRPPEGWRSAGLTEGVSWALIRVSDTGAGMDQRVQQRAFEPYFTTKPRGQGTGLGLTMARATVERHGGEIEMWSEPGRGTAFEIALPLGAPGAGPAEHTGEGERVLLVSAGMVASATAAMLRGIGRRVSRFPGLNEAAADIALYGFGQTLLVDLDSVEAVDGSLRRAVDLVLGGGGRVVITGGDPVSWSVTCDRPGVIRLPKPFGADDLAAVLNASS